MKKLFAALLGAFLATSAAAQQIGPGEVMSNSTAAKAPAAPNSVNATLNRALGSTANRVVCNIAGTWQSCAAPILGSVGTMGLIQFLGSTSGTVTVTPQAAAGTPTLTLPNATGTFAVGATTPLALDATTGMLTCPTCALTSGAVLSRTNDTNVTLTLGGSPNSALVNAASLALGWTGTLSVARGGLGGAPTATTDRYLKGNGTIWVTSSGAASGVGSCGGGQFVNGLNSDASPTCSTPAGSGNVATSGTPTVNQLGQWVTSTTIRGVDINTIVARGMLYGLTLSNNATDATNDFDVAIGEAADANAFLMRLTSGYTKQTDAAWAVGSAAGCLDTGAVGNNTYHVWLMQRSDTGVVDIACTLSTSGPATGGGNPIPAAYDRFRRIGSIIRSGGAILPFSQDGDTFLLKTPVTATLPGSGTGSTSAQTATMTTPTGIKTTALISAAGWPLSGTDGKFYVSSFDQTDVAVTGGNANVGPAGVASLLVWSKIAIRTDVSSAVRFRAQATTAQLFLTTEGWIDPRGRL